MGRGGWPALPDRTKIAHADQALPKTAAPNTTTPAAVGSGIINSNIAQPKGGQIASPRPLANPDSDVRSTDSFGGGNGNLKYVESTKNPPMISENTPDLMGHIIKLEIMNKVS